MQAKITTAIKTGDPYTGSYDLKAWPRDMAGQPPSRGDIIAARALLGSTSNGTKRELAVAAYLRRDALNYSTKQVALALQLVCGGKLNPLLNVANRDLESKWQLGKVHKVKIEGGTAYQFRPNKAGLRCIEMFKASLGGIPQPEPATPAEGNGNGHEPSSTEGNAVETVMASSTTPDIEADVEEIRNRDGLTETEWESLIQARRGQGCYRQQVMKLGDGRCAVTGCSVSAVLEACHIKPWKISTDYERLDANNGICLVANLHKLFDAGLGKLNKVLTTKQKEYLEDHRKTIFKA